MVETNTINDKRSTKYRGVAWRPCINRRRTASTPFLPDEIVFHILLRLPADILFNTMRYVCKQWYNIIKDPLFIREQLPVHSVVGVCFQCRGDRIVSFAQFGKRRGRLSELVVLPSSAEVVSTCDGLMLFRYETIGGSIHVANPLTRQLLTLPPTEEPMPGRATYSIGRSRFSVEYKVVFMCISYRGSVRYGVITLGKDDKWRVTDSCSLCGCDWDCKVLLSQPIMTGKFLHWLFPFVNCKISTMDKCNLYTMDMESEKIHVVSSPKSDNSYVVTKYVVRGESVTCMKSYFDMMMWEVWVSLDDTCREWKKLCVIDFRPRKLRLRRTIKDLFRKCSICTAIRPVAWIQNGDVVIFKTYCLPDPFFAYNIKSGYTFQLRCHDNHICHGFYSSYAPSLLSPN